MKRKLRINRADVTKNGKVNVAAATRILLDAGITSPAEIVAIVRKETGFYAHHSAVTQAKSAWVRNREKTQAEADAVCVEKPARPAKTAKLKANKTATSEDAVKFAEPVNTPTVNGVIADLGLLRGIVARLGRDTVAAALDNLF